MSTVVGGMKAHAAVQERDPYLCHLLVGMCLYVCTYVHTCISSEPIVLSARAHMLVCSWLEGFCLGGNDNEKTKSHCTV